MTCRGAAGPWVLAFALLLRASAANGQELSDFLILSPPEGRPAFGTVEVVVEVYSLEVRSVDIEVDGEHAATLTEPPFRALVDVGEENVEHSIVITVTDVDGRRSTRTRTTGTIRIDEEMDLELQSLYVTVTRDGERVLDLDAEDFRVLDDGRPQQIVTFERGDVPLTAVLLIDASLSMEGEGLAAALSGARAFVEEMGELDEAKVMVFSDRLLASTPFTLDPSVVSALLDRTSPSGSTAINDHLYLALSELGARTGRRVIVLLSDGLDVDSVLRMADVDWSAGRVQSVIYWIRPTFGADLDQSHSSVWRDAAAQRREVQGLGTTVRRNGGREYAIERIEEAPEAFRELLAELRDQYVLGYYPTNDLDDDAWHEIEVRVDEPRVKVGVRGGYYDAK